MATQKAEMKLKRKFEKFLVDQVNDVDENFAYEGLFDKKESNKLPNPVEKSRIDLSNIMGPLSKSRIVDDDK